MGERISLAEVDRNVRQGRVTELLDAAPTLIEIARTALAYEQSKADAALARRAYAHDGSDSMFASVWAHDKDEIRCRDAYLAALARVEP